MARSEHPCPGKLCAPRLKQPPRSHHPPQTEHRQQVEREQSRGGDLQKHEQHPRVLPVVLGIPRFDSEAHHERTAGAHDQGADGRSARSTSRRSTTRSPSLEDYRSSRGHGLAPAATRRACPRAKARGCRECQAFSGVATEGSEAHSRGTRHAPWRAVLRFKHRRAAGAAGASSHTRPDYGRSARHSRRSCLRLALFGRGDGIPLCRVVVVEEDPRHLGVGSVQQECRALVCHQQDPLR
jgi:hypothetical protein